MKLARFSVCAISLGFSFAQIGCGSEEADEQEEGIDDPGPPNEEDPDPMEPVAEGCGLKTDYAGDENCIPAPSPEEGVQLHVGPSSYDDPEVINAQDANGNYLWLMMPGDERTACYHLIAPNDVENYYFKQQYRMRIGSHHMILQNSGADVDTVKAIDADFDAGVMDAEAAQLRRDELGGWGKCSASIIDAIGGTQSIVEDLPPGGIVAPEDEGLARKFQRHHAVDLQLHFYNTTDAPRLREVWVNFLWMPADEFKTNLGMLGGFTRMNVAPHSQATVGNVCKAEQAIPASPRIVTLFGHAHTHNTRFAVWHDKADGSSELVYDSYEGAEAPTFTYNTVVKNPTADPDNRVTGAKSGLLTLAAGEQLRYSCEIDNTTDFTFYGRNEVNTDEMCNLFGSVQGLGFPCFTLPAGTGTR